MIWILLLEVLTQILLSLWKRDSVVGIVIRYRLDGPGIESQWRRFFPHLSRPALRPTLPPVQWYRVFPGGKAAGTWR